jgi:NACHT domain
MQKPAPSTLTKCLKDMLRLPGQPPIYIIIDAIDECPTSPETPSSREEVLGLIKELIDLRLPKVHLCAASRPDIDIQMVLEPLTSLRISLHDEIGQKEDITNYIQSVVHSDENLRKEDKLVVDTLSDKADGS